MNKKNAERHLHKKFEDFVSSIADREIAELIKDNTIICGGAIASLLLGEKVNDYDLYFTNPDVTERVAKYFVDKYNEIHPTPSGEISVTREEGTVKIKISSSGASSETDDNYQYFESTEDGEADSFVENLLTSLDATRYDEDALTERGEEKEEEPKPYRPVFLTQNAITLSDDIQIIIRFSGTPAEIHQNFDYEHTKMAWNSRTNTLVTRKSALESLLARELVYTGSLYPICSLFRIRKYLNRGWTINAGQIFKMAWQVSELNLSDMNVLEDQLIGVDTAYFSELLDVLNESKKKEIDATYIMSLVDKIF